MWERVFRRAATSHCTVAFSHFLPTTRKCWCRRPLIFLLSFILFLLNFAKERDVGSNRSDHRSIYWNGVVKLNRRKRENSCTQGISLTVLPVDWKEKRKRSFPDRWPVNLFPATYHASFGSDYVHLYTVLYITRYREYVHRYYVFYIK